MGSKPTHLDIDFTHILAHRPVGEERLEGQRFESSPDHVSLNAVEGRCSIVAVLGTPIVDSRL